jgi:GNAT superfamily N-acetyltransferase
MRIERIDDPAGFYAAVTPFLERREAQHNLQLGLRDRLESDRHAFGPVDPRLFAVRDDGGDVIAAATQTPPFGLILSEIDADGVVEALVERLSADGLDLPAALGPVARVQQFARLWAERTGTAAHVAIEQRIYEATHVERPDVEGAFRRYAEADRDLAVAWIEAFFDEAIPGSPLADGERFVTERRESLWFWDAGGKHASIAGQSGDTPNGSRVGPVYTPPELRGRGYGSAVTAALTAHLLETRRFCFLFTDLANPTSNSIYQRIGYRPVTDVTMWRFEAP